MTNITNIEDIKNYLYEKIKNASDEDYDYFSKIIDDMYEEFTKQER